MKNANEYLTWALNEKQRLEKLNKTGSGQYAACMSHQEAAKIIISDPKLANSPRRDDEADIRSWGTRILTSGEMAIRKYNEKIKPE